MHIIAIYWHVGDLAFFTQVQPQEFSQLNYKNALYFQAGAHIGADLNSPAVSSMQVERRPTWMPGPPENPAGGAQLPGPPTLGSGQMGSNIQPPHPPQVIFVGFSLVTEWLWSHLLEPTTMQVGPTLLVI